MDTPEQGALRAVVRDFCRKHADARALGPAHGELWAHRARDP